MVLFSTPTNCLRLTVRTTARWAALQRRCDHHHLVCRRSSFWSWSSSSSSKNAPSLPSLLSKIKTKGNQDKSWQTVTAVTIVGGVLYLIINSKDPDNERRRAFTSNPSFTKYLRRIPIEPRPDWFEKCAAQGFEYGHYPGVLWPAGVAGAARARDNYWNETATYQVTSADGMWMLEKAAYEIHSVCLQAVQDVVESDELLHKFGIPTELWPAVRHSWRTRQTDLAERLDFLWDGASPPKFCEANADTPTVLVECAGSQRSWMQDYVQQLQQHQQQQAGIQLSQFNVLQEALEEAFEELKREHEQHVERNSKETPPPLNMVFTTQRPSVESDFLEERSTTAYMCQRAQQAGILAQMMDIEDLDDPQVLESVLQAALVPSSQAKNNYNNNSNVVNAPSLIIWKLYPYEWLIQEKLGIAVIRNEFLQEGHVQWLEPAWKLILSSKAMLAYLWEKHPGHDNLVPAFYSFHHLEQVARTATQQQEQYLRGKEWVAKPRFGREGVGIMYSDGYETWADFRNACLQASASFQKVPSEFSVTSLAARVTNSMWSFPGSVGNHGLGGGRNGTTDPSKTMENFSKSANLTTFQHNLKQLLDRYTIKSDDEHLIKSIMDREWGSKHVHDSGPFGYHVGEPIVQAYAPPCELSGRSVVTSAWVVRGVPAAVCFREDIARTTNDDSSFVPHCVSIDPSSSRHMHQRNYPLSNEQKQLRRELYGRLPVGQGRKRRDETSEDSSSDHHLSELTYAEGGYRNCGVAPVGGGGPKDKPTSKARSDVSPSHRWTFNSFSSSSSGNKASPSSGDSNFSSRTGGHDAQAGKSTGDHGKEAGKAASERPIRSDTFARRTFRTGSTARGAARANRGFRG